jgi:hypothetical protein
MTALLLTTNTLCLLHLNKEGIDYDDPFSVQSKIEDSWWLTHLSCKYLLFCLVRKDCKDIITKPCEQPPGKSRKAARKEKTTAIELERSVAKLDRPVEKYGDVDHQLKKVRLSGMQAHAKKIIVDIISTQIKNLKKNADVYKAIHGETVYNNLLVSLISKMTGGGSTTNSGGTPTSVFALSSGEQTMLDDDNDEDE